MKLDKEYEFSDAQALTATANSTNVIDLGVDRDIGVGEPMCVMISVGVAADTASANETYQFQLETDDNVSFSSATVIADRTIAKESLTAGSVHILPIGHANERYLRVAYTLGGTTPSITVDAYLMPMKDAQANSTYYASGYTIQ